MNRKRQTHYWKLVKNDERWKHKDETRQRNKNKEIDILMFSLFNSFLRWWTTNLVLTLTYRLIGMRCAILEAQVMESNPQNRQQYHAWLATNDDHLCWWSEIMDMTFIFKCNLNARETFIYLQNIANTKSDASLCTWNQFIVQWVIIELSTNENL